MYSGVFTQKRFSIFFIEMSHERCFEVTLKTYFFVVQKNKYMILPMNKHLEIDEPVKNPIN